MVNTSAWNIQPVNSKSRFKPSVTKRYLSDQWDDEYDDAQKELVQKQLEKDLDDDDFFDKPLDGTDEENRRRIREVLRARAQANGIQKADNSALREVQERAVKETMARRNAYQNGQNNGLDFSELTEGFQAPEDREIPLDIEDLMSEEEKRQADPLGFEPIWVWFFEEFKQIEWKGWDRTIEVAIKLIIFSVVCEKGLNGVDGALEQWLLSIGKYPTKEAIDTAREQRLQMARELTNPGSLNLPPISPPANNID